MHDEAMPMSELSREPAVPLDDGKQPQSTCATVRPGSAAAACARCTPVSISTQQSQQHTAGKDIVSNGAIMPTAIGTGPLADPPAIESECRDFCVAAPDEVGSGCIEPFLTVRSPEAGRA